MSSLSFTLPTWNPTRMKARIASVKAHEHGSQGMPAQALSHHGVGVATGACRPQRHADAGVRAGKHGRTLSRHTGAPRAGPVAAIGAQPEWRKKKRAVH